MHDESSQRELVDQARQIVNPIFKARIDVDIQITFRHGLIGLRIRIHGLIPVLAPAVGVGGHDKRPLLFFENFF